MSNKRKWNRQHYLDKAHNEAIHSIRRDLLPTTYKPGPDLVKIGKYIVPKQPRRGLNAFRPSKRPISLAVVKFNDMEE